MNWNHLRAMLWLRWRILANRVRRGGKVGNALFAVLIVLVAAASAGFFALALVMGREMLPEAEPVAVMAAWAGLALGFLFTWTVGLLTDLQRSDAMSFKHLLHLPVSLGWVFLYNYLSSFVSFSAAIFLPAMIGLSIATVLVHGPLMLVSIPLVLGYFAMITALTYQLRGWLARLMENKRRGRNIVAAITVLFVLIVQVPNLINLRLHNSDREADRQAARERSELERAAEEERLERAFSLGAMVIPIGWLPYGTRAAWEGRWLSVGLCLAGLWGIGAWSLRRSYRSTVAAIVGTGSVEAAKTVNVPSAEGASSTSARSGPLFVERRLPFANQRVAGMALAGLRSLSRAPETKLLLLSPIVFLGLFGFLLSGNPSLGRTASFAPMMSLGAITMGLLSIGQLLQNQFGLDRDGFRAYVLSPVPRHEILIAKNLAVAPLGIGIGVVALIGLQFLVPVDAAHFLGACLQLVSAYLLLCLVDNMISILGPMRLREHGLKAADVRFKTVLLQVVVVLLIPLTLSPLLLPAAAEFLFGLMGWPRPLPLYPLLHAVELGGVLLLYRWLIPRQGALLQARERRILAVLTSS